MALAVVYARPPGFPISQVEMRFNKLVTEVKFQWLRFFPDAWVCAMFSDFV